jgi:hypothetical protein
MNPALKKLSWKHKNNKVLYYGKNFIRQIIPGVLYRSLLEKKLSGLKNYDTGYLRTRINYYNKLEYKQELSESVKPLRNFTIDRRNKTYFFDSYEYTRYFPDKLRAAFQFGDVTYVPEEPSIVKSRPVSGDNANSVLLNLDKVRHFTFTKDKRDFKKKKNMLVSRNYVTQPHRLKLLEMYFNHPLCNIGKINNNGEHNNFLKEILTIDEQLNYKFILCLEGNDVASNLKWVMSSQSLAVMPLPRYETWFMEATLIPDFHYVLIKNDYSDLRERLEYFISHEDKALEIIKNAHDYISQFRIKHREDLISLLVLEKYFYMTNQIEAGNDLKMLFS